MRRKNDLSKIVLCSLILFLCVGYAVVNSITLSITGSASAANRDLDVTFTGITTISKPLKGSASAPMNGKTGTFTSFDMTLNEVNTFSFDIRNNEVDVAANITISISGGNEYFKITPSMTSSTIQPGTSIDVYFAAEMIKVPLNSNNSTASYNISILAEPVKPKEMVTVHITGLITRDIVVEEGMTWKQYIDSPYNDSGIYEYYGSVLYSTAVITDGGVNVLPTDVIKSGYNYGSTQYLN